MEIPVEILRLMGPNFDGGLANILASAGSGTKVPPDDICLEVVGLNQSGHFYIFQ